MRKMAIGAGSWEERADSTVKEGRLQGGKGGQEKRISQGKARAGECTQRLSKKICRVLVSLQGWPRLKWKGGWETKGLS